MFSPPSLWKIKLSVPFESLFHFSENKYYLWAWCPAEVTFTVSSHTHQQCHLPTGGCALHQPCLLPFLSCLTGSWWTSAEPVSSSLCMAALGGPSSPGSHNPMHTRMPLPLLDSATKHDLVLPDICWPWSMYVTATQSYFCIALPTLSAHGGSAPYNFCSYCYSAASKVFVFYPVHFPMIGDWIILGY